MSIKQTLETLVEDMESLRMHVRDTGMTKHGAMLHDLRALAETAADQLTPPREPSEEMHAAGVTAMANMPPDTSAADVVRGVLVAALGVA